MFIVNGKYHCCELMSGLHRC